MLRKQFKIKLKLLFTLLVGWLFIVPLTYIIRSFSRKKYIIFIGRDKGLFLDNVKYLFNHFYQNKKILKDKNIDFVFLTENRNTYFSLKEKNLPVIFYPSIEAFKILLNSKLLIVDNIDWYKKLKYYFLFFTKKLQLWHGVGFKYIELQNKNDYYLKNKCRKFFSRLIGRYPKYDIVISTSKFYAKKVFSKAFESKEIWTTGYPRNDIFFRKPTVYDLIYTDTDILQKIKNLKKKYFKVLLYAPTFRDSGGDVFTDNVLDIKRLDEFLKENNFFLLIKFHPNPNFNYASLLKSNNIYLYDKSKDIYPLLKEMDCLITDYSSIFMDFLLLDKPIIFFPYDFEKYITKDRKIQFDYNWITPGPKVFNQSELEKELIKILVKKIDKYKDQREKIRNLAFEYQDGLASKRIFNKILNLLDKNNV